MKKLFLSLAILASISFTTVSAQNGHRKGDRSGSKFSKELNLSAEQQTKMESANADFRTKMKELKAQSDLSKEDKMAKMKEMKEQHQTAVNSILTPEQQTKMKDLRARKDSPRKDGKGRKAMAMHNNKDKKHRGDKMKDLNLTEDQKSKIKALNEDFRTKSRELAQKHREELNKVYTPEQQAKINEFRKDFDKNKDGKFSRHGKKGMHGNLDQASKDKLKELRADFQKQKKAVEMSRIAPEAQQQKIRKLRSDLRKEQRQIIENAKKEKAEKPV